MREHGVSWGQSTSQHSPPPQPWPAPHPPPSGGMCVIFLRHSWLPKKKGKGFKCLPWWCGKLRQMKNLNALTACSSLTSPWNRQSDLPLGVQLPLWWHFARGIRVSWLNIILTPSPPRSSKSTLTYKNSFGNFRHLNSPKIHAGNHTPSLWPLINIWRVSWVRFY